MVFYGHNASSDCRGHDLRSLRRDTEETPYRTRDIHEILASYHENITCVCACRS